MMTPPAAGSDRHGTGCGQSAMSTVDRWMPCSATMARRLAPLARVAMMALPFPAAGRRYRDLWRLAWQCAPVRTAIWDGMVTNDGLVRYYGKLAGSLSRREKMGRGGHHRAWSSQCL